MWKWVVIPITCCSMLAYVWGISKLIQRIAPTSLFPGSAVAERPGLMPNYTDKAHIRLTRYLLPSAMEYLQSLSISNSWVNKIMYEVDIPSKAYGEGDKIPVTFRLTPIAPDIKIRSVVCVLKEYTSYT
ncbi:hypothetical protein BC937DRAFT_87800, partial [Endogone sp. FLAS-F59071]